jgi:hypothetical protein
MGRIERDDRQVPHPHYARLAAWPVAHIAADLPFHAKLLCLCDNRASKIWSD